MKEELARVDWKGSLAGKTVEQQWQEFLSYSGGTTEIHPKEEETC